MDLSLAEIAERLQAELRGDAACRIERVTTLERAGAGDISFLTNRRYRAQLLETGASAVLINPADSADCPTNALLLDNPYLGYARVAAWLNPVPPLVPGIHPTAVVAKDTSVDTSAQIGAHVVIDSGASGAAGALVPAASAGPRSHGEGTRLVARVTLLEQVEVGDRCVLHPGVVIGTQGFGIANDNGVWVNIPQLGRVVIGNDVDIGANSCVDRGAGRHYRRGRREDR